MKYFVPQEASKYEVPSVFGPKDYLTYARSLGLFNGFPIPTSAIMVFDHHVYHALKKEHPGQETRAFFRLHVLEKDRNQIGICGGFGIGAPAAVIAMEELIALGVRSIVAVGTSGSLQKDLRIGSTVLPNQAIRDEGTSHHYVPGTRFASPSPDLLGRLRRTLNASQRSFREGAVWTTDAPYRETRGEVEKLQNEGVLAVEMEASALFTVGTYRKAEVAALLNVSDDLSHLRWNPQLHDSERQTHLIELSEIALEVLRS